jgi:hypothetical protein
MALYKSSILPNRFAMLSGLPEPRVVSYVRLLQGSIRPRLKVALRAVYAAIDWSWHH